MRSLHRIGVAVSLFLIPCFSLADEIDTARAAWHDAIAQQYRALHAAAGRLSHTVGRFCEAPDELSRETLENDWLAAYQAWQAVRFVQFGPIEHDSRGWQLQFWPDRKNLVGQKIDTVLRSEVASTALSVANESVAVQGFPALEYLLYDAATDTQALSEPTTCALLQAIATHVEETTAALDRDWLTFEEHYQTTPHYTEATLSSAIQALALLEEKRLGEPLGLQGSPANSYLAEAWRSERSVRLMESTLSGLQAGFMPGLTHLLNEIDESALNDRFGEQLEKALAHAGDESLSIVSALEDPDAFRQLQSLYINISQLRYLLEREIAPALGVVQGFNASDGD